MENQVKPNIEELTDKIIDENIALLQRVKGFMRDKNYKEAVIDLIMLTMSTSLLGEYATSELKKTTKTEASPVGPPLGFKL